MTNNLKIEVLVSNIPEDGSIASQFPSQEYVNQQLAKKANLSPQGRLDPLHAPDYTEIPGLYEHIEDTKDAIETSIADSLQDAKGYTNQQLSTGLQTKADLVNGKIPFDQIPFSADIEDQIQINVENITAVVDQKVAQVVEQVNGVATAANSYTDTKVAENKTYVDTTVGNVIEDVTTIVDTKAVSKAVTIPTYLTPEAGVAAGTGVAAGAYYNVRSTEDDTVLVEYQNIGGVPTPTGKEYPSYTAVERLQEGYAIKKYLLDSGINESELDGDYNFLMQRFAQTVVDKGWDASFVIDGNLTQHERNKGIKSIAQLRLTAPAAKGDRVYLASVNEDQGEGGGNFLATQKTGLADNGGTIIASPDPLIFWVRQNVVEVTPEMFGAKGFPHDDTVALQAALDFISPTQWDTSVAVMNQKGGGGKLVLPRRYRTTDTLWVGAYTSIEGLGALGFNSSLLKNVSAIVTDFTNPLKPAMSSSNWKTGGVRVAYDEQTTGAMYDNGLVSATHGIKASGFSLLTKSGTRCYMGFRLQNSPQSDINIYANGFDYGIMSNASWDSRINSRCLSYKCGLLLNFDSNNLVFDGYYNALGGDVISGSTNLITFFTPDTETDVALNGPNIKFGAVNRYSFGASSNSLIAEHNDVGCVVCNGAANFQTLYTESNRIAGFVSFTNYSKTIIGNFVGHADASVCILGANSQLEIVASNKTGTAQGKYFKLVSVYNSDLTVPRTLNEYVQGIRYAGYEHILYVSSSGNNLNSGVVDAHPLATIDEAISRITMLSRFSNSNLKLGNCIRVQVVLLTGGDFSINTGHGLYCDMDIISVASSAPTLKFNSGYLTLNNTRVTVVNCNVLKGATVGTMENAAFWSRNGANTVSIYGGNTNIQGGGLVYCDYNGASDITLTLNNVSVVGTASAQLVQGNYLNTSPHIVSVVRALGSISADITSRADKGVSVPSTWQNKILGI